jgi:hypothetical protein
MRSLLVSILHGDGRHIIASRLKNTNTRCHKPCSRIFHHCLPNACCTFCGRNRVHGQERGLLPRPWLGPAVGRRTVPTGALPARCREGGSAARVVPRCLPYRVSYDVLQAYGHTLFHQPVSGRRCYGGARRRGRVPQPPSRRIPLPNYNTTAGRREKLCYDGAPRLNCTLRQGINEHDGRHVAQREGLLRTWRVV